MIANDDARLGSIHPLRNVRNGQTCLAEMNAARAFCNRHIQAIVDDDPSRRTPRNCLSRQCRKLSRRQILLANLDPIDAGRRHRSNFLNER
jgi:hypothetical protein